MDVLVGRDLGKQQLAVFLMLPRRCKKKSQCTVGMVPGIFPSFHFPRLNEKMHASEPRDKQMEIREDRKTDPELHKLNPILYRIFNAFVNITEPRLQF